MPINKQKIQRAIPRGMRRLPGLRSIEALQYYADKDVERRLQTLKSVFPHGLMLNGECIEYDRSYMIAMSARVGSTALVTALGKGGLSDFEIREVFNNRGYLDEFAKILRASSLTQYLNQYALKSGGGRLPLKVGWWDMAPILEFIQGDLETWFPNASWIYLERKDRVAQAYSLWKAANHGIWHLKQGDDYQCPVVDTIPLHDIREMIKLINAENIAWKNFFNTNNIQHSIFYYEDFCSNPEKTTLAAFKALTGTEMEAAFDCPIAKSSDARDQENIEELRRRLG